jgi:hypothetical protein
MDGTLACMGEVKNSIVHSENLKGRIYLGDLCMDGRITLK